MNNIQPLPSQVMTYFNDYVLRRLAAQEQKALVITSIIIGILAVMYIFRSRENNAISNATLFTGQAKYTTPTGDIVEGDFINGELHGHGKIICKNGDVWEGEFEKNKMNGPGKKSYADGSVEEGEFKDGQFVIEGLE